MFKKILWMNLVTDGLPALALSVEPPERHVMRRGPYPPDAPILGRRQAFQILLYGLLMGLASLLIGYAYWRTHRPEWQTMVFTTLTLSQMGAILALRSERDSLMRRGICTNRPLLASILMTLALQFAIIYVPALQVLLQTRPLPFLDLTLALAVNLIGFAGIELAKYARRRSEAKKADVD